MNAGAPSAVLHYIFDPLCGWCYAAAPLVQAARQLPDLAIALHGGGMLAGPNRIAITPRWRDHVVPHDRRIAQLTGQPFGEAYFDGLLRDPMAMMDSEPPTTAILAAQALGATDWRWRTGSSTRTMHKAAAWQTPPCCRRWPRNSA